MLSGFNDINPVTFLYEHDSDLLFNQESFVTQQGLTLNLVNALSGCKDETILNYSNIFLTDTLPTNEVMYLKPVDPGALSFSTYLAASAFPGMGTDTRYISISSSKSTPISSALTYSNTLSDPQATYFLFTDLNGLQCRISSIVDNTTRSLTYNFLTSTFYFSTQTAYITSKQNDIFEYSLSDAGYLKLFFRYGNKFYIIRSMDSVLSACDVTRTPFLTTYDLFYTTYRGDHIYNFKNDFVYYDKPYVKDFIVNEDKTIEDIKQNYVLYYNYQSTNNFLTGAKAIIDFYKPKNVLSNDYYINDKLPFSINDVTQRRYTTILSKQNSETFSGNFQLNYNYYTKEYLFVPDVVTKFTLPATLYPYTVINIDDSNLTNAGAYGGSSPVFSDKITKWLNPNTNVVNYNEATGIYLYSWLYTDNAQLTSFWVDRYYNPLLTSLNTAFSGNSNQIYSYVSNLSTFLLTNNISVSSMYYDIRSSLTLEPSATYYYSRIGNKYVDKVVNTFKKAVTAFVAYDKFNTYQGTQNTMLYGDGNYGAFKLTPDNDNSFTISLNLNTGHLDNVNTNLLVGNNFDEGVSLYKGGDKNIFTPGFFVNTLTGVSLFDINGINTFTVDVSAYVEAPVKVIDVVNTGFDHLIKIFYVNLSNNTPGFLDFSIYNKIFNKYEFPLLAGQFLNTNEITVYDKLYYGDSEIWYLVKPGLGSSRGLSGNYIAKFDYFNNNLLSYAPAVSTSELSFVTFNGSVSSLSGFCGAILDNYIGVSKLNNTVYFRNLSTGVEYASLYLNSGGIFDIITYDDKMYVQTNGYVATYDKYKRSYTTYNTNSNIVSGVKLDIINENFIPKLISYGADKFGTILVDKFDLQSGDLEATYNTGVLVDPIYFNEFYYAKKAVYNTLVGYGVVSNNFTPASGGVLIDTLTAVNLNSYLNFSSYDSNSTSVLTCRVQTQDNNVLPVDVVLSLSANTSPTVITAVSGYSTQSSSLQFTYSNVVPNTKYSLICSRANAETLPVVMTVDILNGSFFRGSLKNAVIGSTVLDTTLSGYSNKLLAYNDMSLTNDLGYVGITNAFTLASDMSTVVDTPTFNVNGYNVTPSSPNYALTNALTGFYNAKYNPYLTLLVAPPPTSTTGITSGFQPTLINFSTSYYTPVPTSPLSGVAFQTPTNYITIRDVNKFNQGDMVARVDLYAGNNYKNKQTKIVPFDVENNSQIVLSFDANDGYLKIYNNAELLQNVALSANTFYTSYFLNNNFGVGMPFINNKAASTINYSYSGFPSNYGISDFVVYDRALNPDEVRFNYLRTQKIDPINFDVPQGTRNNTDTVTSFNKLVIPGRKNNNIKVYIKNASLDSIGEAKLTAQLVEKIKNVIPVNVSDIKFEYLNYESD